LDSPLVSRTHEGSEGIGYTNPICDGFELSGERRRRAALLAVEEK
jgi:hypothetical protein